jgi:hypothetical protein
MNNPNPVSTDKDNLKIIQTRKEYLESLINQLGSGQIKYDKLVAELTEELKSLYSLLEGLQAEATQIKSNYEFILNIIISMPEVQKNSALTRKIQERFPENSHP